MIFKAIAPAFLFLVDAALAEAPAFRPEELAEQETLTGDWMGGRTHLEERYGIKFDLHYIGETWGNTSGGLRTGASYVGLLELAMEVELEKLTGGAWKEATFFASGLLPHGESPSGNYVGDIFAVSNIDAPHTITLFEVWLEQNVGPFSLRFGQLAADSEFVISDQAALFLNGTFGLPAGISSNAPVPSYPVAAPGARIRVDFNEQTFLAAGLFDGDGADLSPGGLPRNRHGIHWTLSKNEGMFGILELAHTHSSTEQSKSGMLPGTLKVGGWIHTGQFADNDGGKMHTNDFGFYGIADQKLWQEEPGSDEGLAVFGRATWSPANRNFFDWYCDAGLVYTGLVPMRKEDQFGVGFAYGHVSNDLQDFQHRTGGPVQTYTSVLEVSYLAPLTPWFSIQPDFQYVMQPDGSSTSEGGVDDAVVAGLRFQVSF